LIIPCRLSHRPLRGLFRRAPAPVGTTSSHRRRSRASAPRFARLLLTGAAALGAVSRPEPRPPSFLLLRPDDLEAPFALPQSAAKRNGMKAAGLRVLTRPDLPALVIRSPRLQKYASRRHLAASSPSA